MEKSRTAIRPGISIDVVDQDRHMKSIAYDVIDRRIIIAQTAPPLTKYNLNREITLTFILKQGGTPFRYGLQARVTDFIPNYKLASTEVVAVGLERTTNPEICNLRMDFRVHSPADSNFAIEMKGRKLSIIDVSAGGFQFSYRGDDLPRINEDFEMTLIIDGDSLRLKANVLRITTPLHHDRSLRHVCVKFVGSSREYERHLMKKIIEIQRKLLNEGKLP
ncbi:MAG: PilZ domain-containing protein [Syntrophales bacterium]|nr:PilZ domain-containing protein [Syntrophales bacterium]